MDICPFSKKPCSNSKNFHITLNFNGEIKECDCCQECANKMAPVPLFMPFANLIQPQNLLSNLHKLNKMEEELEDPDFHCDNCGISLFVVKAHGKFGCSKCYDNFKQEIEILLPQVQNGGKKHNGKEPKFSNIEIMKKKLHLD
jgi:protein arginine kinase activator